MNIKQIRQTLEELSLLRAVTEQLIHSDESTKQVMLDSIDKQFFLLAEELLLPFSDMCKIYNKPQNEVELIVKKQREAKKALIAPLYFKDSMGAVINDAQANYEINVLGLGHKIKNNRGE